MYDIETDIRTCALAHLTLTVYSEQAERRAFGTHILNAQSDLSLRNGISELQEGIDEVLYKLPFFLSVAIPRVASDHAGSDLSREADSLCQKLHRCPPLGSIIGGEVSVRPMPRGVDGVVQGPVDR